ncbi:unnamed protein product [Prunus armeniaca]
MAQLVSARRRHRPASTTDTTSTMLLVCWGHSHRTPTTSRWRTSIDSSLRGTSSGRATCTTILRHLMIHKSLFRRVARCRLKGGRIVGHGSALIFQAPDYVGGSKFPEIDVFGNIYVQPRNELTESLHPVSSLGVRLPTSSRYSDRVCGSSTRCWVSDIDEDVGSDSQEEARDILSRDGECPAEGTSRRPGTYYRGMGNARRREPRPHSSAQSNNQVTALTAKVAELQGQMLVILQSLARSGIPVPQFDASTSEPVHPEYGHQTSAPADQ